MPRDQQFYTFVDRINIDALMTTDSALLPTSTSRWRRSPAARATSSSARRSSHFTDPSGRKWNRSAERKEGYRLRVDGAPATENKTVVSHNATTFTTDRTLQACCRCARYHRARA